ncbi:MAG: GntR family transcriptional regulator [Candidatus Puniceispirillaceae bacterium]
MNLTQMRRVSVPLHAEVAELLRRQILSGSIQAGEKIPGLNELSEKFGVARMTIRQAMDALEDEGLIERYAGKGTFAKKIDLPLRQKLNMKAELSQLQAMVAQLEVMVVGDDNTPQIVDVGGRAFRHMRRIHLQSGEPFCHVDIKLENQLYLQAPARFEKEIVVTVLKDLGVAVETARQNVTIAYADVEMAETLNMPVNAPVFRVLREFYSDNGTLIYSAILIYPGDKLELEVEFAI